MKIEEALRFHSMLKFIETNNLYDNFIYDFDFIDTIHLNYDNKTFKYTEYTRYSFHENMSLYKCYEKWGDYLWKSTKLHMTLNHVISDLYVNHGSCPNIEINRQHRFVLNTYEKNFQKYITNTKRFLEKLFSHKLPLEVIAIIHEKFIDDYESDLKSNLRFKMAKYQ
jgi:hypothetical protein